MNSKRIAATLLVLSLTMSTALVGCGNVKSDGKSTTSSKECLKMDKEQYLNLTLDEPKSLDIVRTGDIYCGQVVPEISEGLTRLEQDANGKDVVKPAGAKNWEHNEESTVWTFHLRDYKWSDGKAVTAQDFEYSMKRALNPKTASPIAYLLFPIKNAQEFNGNKEKEEAVGVKALDDKTLKLTLSKPCPYFLNLTYYKAMYPQRKDMVEKHGEKFGSEPDTMVYSGPFKVSSWTHNNQIVLSKNEKYWDKDSVSLQKVSYKIIKDASAQYASLYSGSIDSIGVSDGKWMDKMRHSGKFDEIKMSNPTTQFSCFNQKSKLFSNVNVRKAFSVALARKDITKVVFEGDEPAYGWIPPSIQLGGNYYRKTAGEDPVKKLSKDFKAKELLKKGLKELGIDEDVSKIEVKFLLGGTDQWSRTFGEYVQQMYKESLGVDIKPEFVEWPVFLDTIYKGNYDIATMHWTSDYNDPSAMFDIYRSDANIMPTFWSNKKYDGLVEKAKTSTKVEERLKYYKEAEKVLLYDEAVVMPIVYRKGNMFTHKYVKSLMSPLFGGIELKHTYIDGRKK